MHYILKYSVVLCCSIYSLASNAISSQAIEQQANSFISELYHTLNSKPKRSMAERVDWFSKQFLGRVYILGSLGEGPHARYDQFPLYRVDGFDCDTYVNTVLSLALADSAKSFQQCMKFNRYKNGVISYTQRNHFTASDWNLNNQNRGVLQDITMKIVDVDKKPVAQISTTVINKPGWYAHKTTDTIRLNKNNTQEQTQRLAELKAKGSALEITSSKVPYIPLTTLFPNNKPNDYLFAQIPNGAIIEIVRPNWDLTKQIGTQLDISHLGFVIWNDNKLYFRQASSQYGKIVEVPLADYLYEALNSPTIKGINIQVVVPKHPVDGDCARFSAPLK